MNILFCTNEAKHASTLPYLAGWGSHLPPDPHTPLWTVLPAGYLTQANAARCMGGNLSLRFLGWRRKGGRRAKWSVTAEEQSAGCGWGWGPSPGLSGISSGPERVLRGRRGRWATRCLPHVFPAARLCAGSLRLVLLKEKDPWLNPRETPLPSPEPPA